MNTQTIKATAARQLIKAYQLKAPALVLTAVAAATAIAALIFSSPILPGADILRNMEFAASFLNGHGLSAKALYPFAVAQENFLVSCPAGAVFSSLLLAAGSLFSSNMLNGAALINLCFYILTVPLLYALTKKTFSKAAALCACIIYIFNPAVLSTALSGSTAAPTMMFVLCSLLVLLEGTKRQHFFAAGILFGVALLWSSYAIAVLPALLCVVIIKNIKNKRLEHSLAFVFPPALMFFALALFSGTLTKHNPALWPAAFLSGTEIFPGQNILRYIKTPDSFFCAFLKSGLGGDMMEEKAKTIIHTLKITTLFGASVIMLVPAILETIIPEKNKANPLKLFFVLASLGLVAAMLLSAPSRTAAYIVAPFATILGAAFFVRLAKRLTPATGTKEHKSLCLALLCLAAVTLNLFIPAKTQTQDFRTLASAIEKKLPLALINMNNTAIVLSPDILPVSGLFKNKSLACVLAPKTPAMLEVFKKQNIDTDIIIFSAKAIRKETPEWQLFFRQNKSSLKTIRTKTHKLIIYIVNSFRMSEEMEAASNKEQTSSQKLALLGKALNIHPQNLSASKTLAALRQTLYAEGARHEKRAQLMLTEPEKTLRAFKNFIIAANLKDNIKSAELGLRVSRMKNDFALTRHSPAEIMINNCPAPGQLSDGQYMKERDGFSCYKPKLKIDLGSARQIDALILKARLNPKTRKTIKSIEISTSIDGWNWRPVKTLPLAPQNKGLNIISIKDLGLFSRFIMLGIDGNDLHEQEIAEVEVWGYIPASKAVVANNPKPHPWTLAEYRNASSMHRNTGKVENDPDSSAPNSLAVSARSGHDKRGLICYGSAVEAKPGKYIASFSVKANAATLSPDTDMFLINVSDTSGRKEIISHTFKAKELKAGTGFNTYCLEFEIQETISVEARLYFNGNGAVSCDTISIKGIAAEASNIWSSDLEGNFVPGVEEIEEFLSEDEKQAFNLI